MNLHAIAGPLVAAVNPPVVGAVRINAGSETLADYTVVPMWRTFPGISMQVQALSAGDLQHIDGLNLQGEVRAVYLNGVVEGLDRKLGKGGDILSFGGNDWLVSTVVEPWDEAGWVKVIVTKQAT